MSMIKVRIVTPLGVYKETNANQITIDTTDGQRGILPNHMPLVTMLSIGKLVLIQDNSRDEYAIANGLFYFHDNVAEIMTDAIESKDEIDSERAEQSRRRAEERLNSHNSNIDHQRAEIALKKAINRLSIKGTIQK